MEWTTKKAAAEIGIHPVTLRRWLAARKIRPSKVINVGKAKIFLWTVRDMYRLRAFKERFYRKGRGRKPASYPS